MLNEVKTGKFTQHYMVYNYDENHTRTTNAEDGQDLETGVNCSKILFFIHSLCLSSVVFNLYLPTVPKNALLPNLYVQCLRNALNTDLCFHSMLLCFDVC